MKNTALLIDQAMVTQLGTIEIDHRVQQHAHIKLFEHVIQAVALLEVFVIQQVERLGNGISRQQLFAVLLAIKVVALVTSIPFRGHTIAALRRPYALS